ncbi:cullin-3-like [Centruroides vittatus]|uniref:cullin-3-like n=1 Tax=Centruroides vittatus TaxID=120091 RepID=UPI00350F31E3
MIMIRDSFMYLDRVYEEENKLESVYNLRLILFREDIIKHEVISNNLRSTLLQMIMTERKEETVDRKFENAFLEQSKQFYREEIIKFLSENDASSYVKKSLIATSRRIGKDILEDELLEKNIKAVLEMRNSGILYVLKFRKTNDLTSMLVRKIEECLMIMADYISSYLRNVGRSFIEDIENRKIDSLIFVQELIGLLEKVDHFLLIPSNSDKYLHKIITGDFEYILNLNSKCAEYLSLFLDNKLKEKYKT